MARNSPIKAAVFASGSGSNAENIMRFVRDEAAGRLEICCVICDKPDAGVIARAEKFGVPCHVIPVEKKAGQTSAQNRSDQEDKVLAVLRQEGVQWAFLAGYLRILTQNFLDFFADKTTGLNRIINIHPSLLPEGRGAMGYQPSFDSGAAVLGCSLHYVDGGVDTGKVIAQAQFERQSGDSLADVQARGLALEYELYRNFLRDLIDGKIGSEHAYSQKTGSAISNSQPQP